MRTFGSEQFVVTKVLQCPSLLLTFVWFWWMNSNAGKINIFHFEIFWAKHLNLAQNFHKRHPWAWANEQRTVCNQLMHFPTLSRLRRLQTFKLPHQSSRDNCVSKVKSIEIKVGTCWEWKVQSSTSVWHAWQREKCKPYQNCQPRKSHRNEKEFTTRSD